MSDLLVHTLSHRYDSLFAKAKVLNGEYRSLEQAAIGISYQWICYFCRIRHVIPSLENS